MILFAEFKWPIYAVQIGCFCSVNGILSEDLSAILCAETKIVGILFAHVGILL